MRNKAEGLSRKWLHAADGSLRQPGVLSSVFTGILRRRGFS